MAGEVPAGSGMAKSGPGRTIPKKQGVGKHFPQAYAGAPWVPSQTYTFVGVLTDGVHIGSYSFNVLAGDSGPSIKSGWAKVNIIDRAYRLGLTIPYGYDPIQYDIPIQFEAVVSNWSNPRGTTVEADIAALEWMAGRGKLFGYAPDHGVGHAATGDPPIVTVEAFDATHQPSNLIEPNLRGIDWIITNLSFGDAPGDVIRSTGRGQVAGSRIRQKCVVSLTQFVAAPGTNNDSPTTRAKGRNSKTAGSMHLRSDKLYDTIQKMVVHYTGNSSTHALKVVMGVNKNLHIKSFRQPLKVGTVVVIPRSLLIK